MSRLYRWYLWSAGHEYVLVSLLFGVVALSLLRLYVGSNHPTVYVICGYASAIALLYRCFLGAKRLKWAQDYIETMGALHSHATFPPAFPVPTAEERHDWNAEGF